MTSKAVTVGVDLCGVEWSSKIKTTCKFRLWVDILCFAYQPHLRLLRAPFSPRPCYGTVVVAVYY